MIPAQLVTLFGRNDKSDLGEYVPVYGRDGELLGFLPWATIAKGALKIGKGIFGAIGKRIREKREAREAPARAAEQAKIVAAQKLQAEILQKQKTAAASSKNMLMIGGGAAALVAVMLIMQRR